MSSSGAVANRSVYLSKVRRAFLLQAHPDRFRRYDADIRLGQERLLQAMSERMALPDFAAYTCGESTHHNQHHSRLARQHQQQQQQQLPYYLQGKDGALVPRTMQLNDSVENLLQSMIDALQQSGVATTSIPPPPPPIIQMAGHNNNNNNFQQQPSADDTFWNTTTSSSSSVYTASRVVDHRFDINTTKGRDLSSFLQRLDPLQIAERKRCRLDATSAAYMVRKAFKFQAVDGTSMGWSSASLAMLLSSLLSVYEEHASKFHVTSFYPLRLVITPDDFHEPLDVIGGILRLNPGSTPIQWLETLQLVTLDQLELLHFHQTLLKEYSEQVQEYFGVKIKRGNSCSAKEYLHFLEHLKESIMVGADAGQLVTTTTNYELQPHSLDELALEGTGGPVVVTVESSTACRRGTVTKDGTIRVGATMSASAVRLAISKLSLPARKRMIQDQKDLQHCQLLMNQVQEMFGLQRVYRAGMVAVSHQQLMDCLQRMMQLAMSNNNNNNNNNNDAIHQNDMSTHHLKHKLAGNALGVVGSGQFCHLGDDGSLIIPFDWR